MSAIIENPEIILIGSGAMSANFGALLKRLDPKRTMQLYEVTDELAQESSHGWSNAGTGHAGICELSYTPFREPDGSVNVSKAVEIFEQFEHSRQFWSYAVESGMATDPKTFINPIPHISFVHGDEQVDFLRARHAGMAAHHFFSEMEYSQNRETIARWAPLLIEGRGEVPIAATKMDGGTDVNFGTISRQLLHWLARQEGCAIATGHRVIDLKPALSGWDLTIREVAAGTIHHNHAQFVFIGAGGGSLSLLQKAGIAESKGLGGFPIGGQWLVCDNPEIVARHHAKVYGQALDAAPTMAVPHLDARILDGRKTLLFGPFAAWTTKFLHKAGSWTDLPGSIKRDNLATLIKIGLGNFDLIKYLIQQGTQSMADRIEVLRVFYPEARAEDWKLSDAGIRVQAIKKTDGEAGIVHYGTEILTNSDHTLSALLGASPGASVSVNIALGVIENCFPDLMSSPEGKARLQEMVPAWGEDIKHPDNAAFFHEMHEKSDHILQLR